MIVRFNGEPEGIIELEENYTGVRDQYEVLIDWLGLHPTGERVYPNDPQFHIAPFTVVDDDGEQTTMILVYELDFRGDDYFDLSPLKVCTEDTWKEDRERVISEAMKLAAMD